MKTLLLPNYNMSPCDLCGQPTNPSELTWEWDSRDEQYICVCKDKSKCTSTRQNWKHVDLPQALKNQLNAQIAFCEFLNLLMK